MRTWSTLVIGALLALTGGCSVIVEDEVGDLRPDLNAKRDVTVALRDFGPHVGQLLSVQVVENLENLDPPPMDRAPLVVAQTIVDPVPSDCLDIRMRRGAPFFADRIDFYADLNMNRTLDPPSAGDHSWRELLDEDGRLLFVHDVQFEDLTVDPGQLVLNAFEMNVTGAEEHEGALVTVLLVGEDLVDPVEGIRRRSVPGMYVTQVAGGGFSFRMEGVADPGTAYDVSIRIGDRTLDCTVEDQRTPTMPGDPLRVEGALASFGCAPGEPPDCAGLEERCDEMGDDEACDELAWQCAFVDCAR